MKGIVLGIGLSALLWATVGAMSRQWHDGKATLTLLACAGVSAWLLKATDTNTNQNPK